MDSTPGGFKYGVAARAKDLSRTTRNECFLYYGPFLVLIVSEGHVSFPIILH